METDDVATAERLDRYLDRLVGGGGAPGDGLDPALAATARYLQSLAVAPPRSLSARGWSSVGAASVVAPGAEHRVRPRPRSRAHDRWRPVATVATAAMLLLTLAMGYASSRLAAPAPSGEEAPSFALYVSEERDGERFVELDPMTLVPREGTPPLEDGEIWWGVISGDGSTLVSIHEPEDGPDPWAPVEDVTIVVRDGRTGAEQTRFHPAMLPAGSPRLSHDGTRLVVQTIPMTSSRPGGTEIPVYRPPTWHVYDTADGRLLATVPREQWRESYAIDHAARHVYQLQDSVVTDDPTELTGPRPAQLIVTELATDGRTKQLILPDVMSGYWGTERILRGSPAIGFLAPALARSPDGQWLAIVHADEDAVTIVDAERLTVERTIRLARPAAWRDRLFALLPLVPQEAMAKDAAIGTEFRAVFGPDGRHLYVTGTDRVINDVGLLEHRSRGLRVLDLERGEIVAELLPEDWGRDYMPEPGFSPDGRSLYVIVPKYPERDDSSAYLLRRLDGRTLETLAEREVGTGTSIMLRPAAA